MRSLDAHDRAVTLYRTIFPPRPDDSVESVRARFDAMLSQFAPRPGTEVSEVDVAGVPSLQVRAAGARDDRAMVWFHGGGYTIGSPRGYSVLASELSDACDLTVVLPDYRLAPKHQFPAAVEDAAGAVGWLIERYGDGAAAVGGDSAGGGLTFAALTVVRDAGGRMPRHAVAVSPLADLTASGASYETNAAHEVALSRGGVAQVRAMYLRGQDPNNPLASPVQADLSGLPPALVLVSSSEVLLDDARTLAGRIAGSGGDVRLVVHEDMVHVWPLFSSFLPEGALALKQIAEFVA
jgi:acetyl esterase/lipase